MDAIQVLRWGLCSIQICADSDLSDQGILDNLNRTYPSGTSNGWMEVARKEPGQKPVRCADHEDRTHYIIYC